VQEVDAAFVVRVVRRHVLKPDLVVDRVARPAHSGDDEPSRLDRARDVRPHLEHAPEVLVPDDEEVVAGRRHAVLRLVDLLVRSVHPDPQHLDEDAAAARHVVDGRLREVGNVDRHRPARMDGYRLHAASVSSS
jgi:hypothetical protein